MGDGSEASACNCGTEEFKRICGYITRHCRDCPAFQGRGHGGVSSYHPVNGGPGPGDAQQPEEQVKGMYFVVDDRGNTLNGDGLTQPAVDDDTSRTEWKECMYPELAGAEEMAHRWTQKYQRSHGVCKEVSRYTFQPIVNKQEFR